jgi:hypothetical protein
MQVKSLVVGIMLVAGLLTGCGGSELDTEVGAAPVGDESGEVTAMACSDCPWLWLRCMRNANGSPEREAMCDESRALCEETFCNSVRQASLCTAGCDSRLNTCLRLNPASPDVCFDRHSACMESCHLEG